MGLTHRNCVDRSLPSLFEIFLKLFDRRLNCVADLWIQSLETLQQREKVFVGREGYSECWGFFRRDRLLNGVWDLEEVPDLVQPPELRRGKE